MAQRISSAKQNRNSVFQRISLFFFQRPMHTALLWLLITVFGIACYSTLLKREGFPAVETPLAVSQGAYLVNDAEKVDREVAKPLSGFILQQSGVKSVQTQSFSNFYIATIVYEDNVEAGARSAEIQKSIDEQNIVPQQATGEVKPFEFGITERGDDMVIAFYSENDTVGYQDLVSKADEAAKFIREQQLPLVEEVSIINPFESAVNPATGEQESTQKSFDRFGKREGDSNKFYDSVVIGLKARPNTDQLELDRQVQDAVSKLNANPQFQDFTSEISASNAPQITTQINELQQTLLEGLLAVLIVGSIIISVRASFITVLSMVTVIAAVNGLLYAIGYSLNTITLFALILGLALIVDDTIIMVEAIDAQRRRLRNPKEIIRVATGKVSQAMIAATTTAALSFAPLLLVGGILGKFIRAIPITLISALAISLFVALVFIPLFSRFLLLRKKQTGPGNDRHLVAGIEAKIARFLSAPMLWAKGSTVKLFGVGIAAIVIGLGFVIAGGVLLREVKFSIFPVDKDSNQVSVQLTFTPGTDINTAQDITNKADAIIAENTGENFVRGSYYGQTSVQTAIMIVELTDYKERERTAPEIVGELNQHFTNFEEAAVKARLVGAGPPPSIFAARVESEQNREGSINLATDISKFLEDVELKRPDGSIAQIESVSPPNPQVYKRDEGKLFAETTAEFVDTDTSALVTLAQQAVEKEFPPERVASYGLDKEALTFDFGQENENQESFRTLIFAFPLLLVAIYFLLSIQFKSLLQPLLIFLAIPFSLFGITLGLFLTNNPFSFFAMLGFFALIGLSIKNTILLTDYANQARKAGMGAVDAAHEALAERFRPLIATSLTAVVSLVPLALTSPFWEGLAVVLIFGLLSSTFLVITVFPYYYLGAEYLRLRFSRKIVLIWIIASSTLVYILIASGFGLYVALAPIVAGIILSIFKKLKFI